MAQLKEVFTLELTGVVDSSIENLKKFIEGLSKEVEKINKQLSEPAKLNPAGFNKIAQEVNALYSQITQGSEKLRAQLAQTLGKPLNVDFLKSFDTIKKDLVNRINKTEEGLQTTKLEKSIGFLEAAQKSLRKLKNEQKDEGKELTGRNFVFAGQQLKKAGVTKTTLDEFSDANTVTKKLAVVTDAIKRYKEALAKTPPNKSLEVLKDQLKALESFAPGLQRLQDLLVKLGVPLETITKALSGSKGSVGATAKDVGESLDTLVTSVKEAGSEAAPPLKNLTEQFIENSNAVRTQVRSITNETGKIEKNFTTVVNRLKQAFEGKEIGTEGFDRVVGSVSRFGGELQTLLGNAKTLVSQNLVVPEDSILSAEGIQKNLVLQQQRIASFQRLLDVFDKYKTLLPTLNNQINAFSLAGDNKGVIRTQKEVNKLNKEVENAVATFIKADDEAKPSFDAINEALRKQVGLQVDARKEAESTLAVEAKKAIPKQEKDLGIRAETARRKEISALEDENNARIQRNARLKDTLIQAEADKELALSKSVSAEELKLLDDKISAIRNHLNLQTNLEEKTAQHITQLREATTKKQIDALKLANQDQLGEERLRVRIAAQDSLKAVDAVTKSGVIVRIRPQLDTEKLQETKTDLTTLFSNVQSGLSAAVAGAGAGGGGASGLNSTITALKNAGDVFLSFARKAKIEVKGGIFGEGLDVDIVSLKRLSNVMNDLEAQAVDLQRRGLKVGVDPKLLQENIDKQKIFNNVQNQFVSAVEKLRDLQVDFNNKLQQGFSPQDLTQEAEDIKAQALEVEKLGRTLTETNEQALKSQKEITAEVKKSERAVESFAQKRERLSKAQDTKILKEQAAADITLLQGIRAEQLKNAQAAAGADSERLASLERFVKAAGLLYDEQANLAKQLEQRRVQISQAANEQIATSIATTFNKIISESRSAIGQLKTELSQATRGLTPEDRRVVQTPQGLTEAEVKAQLAREEFLKNQAKANERTQKEIDIITKSRLEKEAEISVIKDQKIALSAQGTTKKILAAYDERLLKAEKVLNGIKELENLVNQRQAAVNAATTPQDLSAAIGLNSILSDKIRKQSIINKGLKEEQADQDKVTKILVNQGSLFDQIRKGFSRNLGQSIGQVIKFSAAWRVAGTAIDGVFAAISALPNAIAEGVKFLAELQEKTVEIREVLLQNVRFSSNLVDNFNLADQAAKRFAISIELTAAKVNTSAGVFQQAFESFVASGGLKAVGGDIDKAIKSTALLIQALGSVGINLKDARRAVQEISKLFTESSTPRDALVRAFRISATEATQLAAKTKQEGNFLEIASDLLKSQAQTLSLTNDRFDRLVDRVSIYTKLFKASFSQAFFDRSIEALQRMVELWEQNDEALTKFAKNAGQTFGDLLSILINIVDIVQKLGIRSNDILTEDEARALGKNADFVREKLEAMKDAGDITASGRNFRRGFDLIVNTLQGGFTAIDKAVTRFVGQADIDTAIDSTITKSLRSSRDNILQEIDAIDSQLLKKAEEFRKTSSEKVKDDLKRQAQTLVSERLRLLKLADEQTSEIAKAPIFSLKEGVNFGALVELLDKSFGERFDKARRELPEKAKAVTGEIVEAFEGELAQGEQVIQRRLAAIKDAFDVFVNSIKETEQRFRNFQDTQFQNNRISELQKIQEQKDSLVREGEDTLNELRERVKRQFGDVSDIEGFVDTIDKLKNEIGTARDAITKLDSELLKKRFLSITVKPEEISSLKAEKSKIEADIKDKQGKLNTLTKKAAESPGLTEALQDPRKAQKEFNELAQEEIKTRRKIDDDVTAKERERANVLKEMRINFINFNLDLVKQAIQKENELYQLQGKTRTLTEVETLKRSRDLKNAEVLFEIEAQRKIAASQIGDAQKQAAEIKAKLLEASLKDFNEITDKAIKIALQQRENEEKTFNEKLIQDAVDRELTIAQEEASLGAKRQSDIINLEIRANAIKFRLKQEEIEREEQLAIESADTIGQEELKLRLSQFDKQKKENVAAFENSDKILVQKRKIALAQEAQADEDFLKQRLQDRGAFVAELTRIEVDEQRKRQSELTDLEIQANKDRLNLALQSLADREQRLRATADIRPEEFDKRLNEIEKERLTVLQEAAETEILLQRRRTKEIKDQIEEIQQAYINELNVKRQTVQAISELEAQVTLGATERAQTQLKLAEINKVAADAELKLNKILLDRAIAEGRLEEVIKQRAAAVEASRLISIKARVEELKQQRLSGSVKGQAFGAFFPQLAAQRDITRAIREEIARVTEEERVTRLTALFPEDLVKADALQKTIDDLNNELLKLSKNGLANFAQGLADAVTEISNSVQAVIQGFRSGGVGGAIGAGLQQVAGSSILNKIGGFSQISPIIGAVGTVVSLIASAFTAAARRIADNIQKSIARINRNLSNGLIGLGDAIVQLEQQRTDAIRKLSGKKGGKKLLDDLLPGLEDQIASLKKQQQEVQQNFEDELKALRAGNSVLSDFTRQWRDINKQVKEYIQSFQTGTAEFEKAVKLGQEFLSLKLRDIQVQAQEELNQAEQEAIQNAIELNDLLKQRTQLIEDFRKQEFDLLTADSLERRQSGAVSRGLELAAVRKNFQDQLANLEQQINLKAKIFNKEKDIFNLTMDINELHARDNQLQLEGIDAQITKWTALKELIESIKVDPATGLFSISPEMAAKLNISPTYNFGNINVNVNVTGQTLVNNPQQVGQQIGNGITDGLNPYMRNQYRYGITG